MAIVKYTYEKFYIIEKDNEEKTYRIKQLHGEKGISQRNLANKIGASPKSVSFWESGQGFNLCLSKLVLINFNVTFHHFKRGFGNDVLHFASVAVSVGFVYSVKF